MAVRCDSCEKGILFGKNVSHAKNRTRKLSFPNLHRFNGVLAGLEGKYWLCTKCLRKAKEIQIKINSKKEIKKEASKNNKADKK